ncbi:addiction module toxin RelE [Spirochaetia bacterium]|nr:addiction module toxin RelE [Spirochaetia bacterium]
MRIFKNKWFAKYAQKADISDDDLRETVKEIETGLIDADYRDGVYKKRIARKGEGKRGGYRVIVFFKKEEKTFFVYGFAKSDMGNISKNQAKDFRATAKYYLVLTDEQIEERKRNGFLTELQGE